MTERLTPSELVYLFVDGEATGAERTEMYAALASDNDLQSEFEDALRLKQTTDEEIAVTMPPFETTKELFLKAGFSLPVPIAGGEAIAPAVSHIADSGIFTALKSLIAPFFVTTGIVATGIVSMPFFDRIQTRTTAPQVSNTSVAQVFPTNNAINAVPDNVPAELAAPPEHLRGEIAQVNTSSYRFTAKTHTRSNAADVPVTVVNEHSVAIVTPEDNTISTTESVAVTSIPAESYRNDQLTSVIIHESPALHIRQLADLRKPATTEATDIWFGMHGIAGLALYPSRVTDGAKELTINNIAMSAEYQITPTSRIGLAAGTETFPHYTVNADTLLTEKWSILWAGASYAITAYDLAVGPFVPSASVMFGGTSTGPLGKFAVGLSWQPDDRVSFTGGIETTGLLYHYGSTLRAAGKLGATYSVAVRF